MMRWWVLLAVVVVGFGGSALAQSATERRALERALRQMDFGRERYNPSPDPEIYYPMNLSDDIVIDDDDRPPLEPNIIVVKYLKQEPPRTLRERVDRLVHGITVDIPPEYDHYGYEMRRYMQAVGNPKIYTDNEFLQVQLLNISKANIVLEYWRKSIRQEIEAMDQLILDKDVSPSTLTAYRANRTQALNFLSLAQNWVDNNKNLLEYIDVLEGQYTLEYPNISFEKPEFMKKYMRLLQKRQETIVELRGYAIFRLMVY